MAVKSVQFVKPGFQHGRVHTLAGDLPAGQQLGVQECGEGGGAAFGSAGFRACPGRF